MLASNIIHEQELILGITDFIDYVYNHIHEYTNSSNQTLFTWANSAYGKAIIDKLPLCEIKNVYVNGTDTGSLYIDITYKTNTYIFEVCKEPMLCTENRCVSSRCNTSLADICAVILLEGFHLGRYVHTMDEYIDMYLNPIITNFLNNFDFHNKNLKK